MVKNSVFGNRSNAAIAHVADERDADMRRDLHPKGLHSLDRAVFDVNKVDRRVILPSQVVAFGGEIIKCLS